MTIGQIFNAIGLTDVGLLSALFLVAIGATIWATKTHMKVNFFDKHVEDSKERAKSTEDKFDKHIEDLKERAKSTEDKFDKHIEDLKERAKSTEDKFDKHIEDLKERAKRTEDKLDQISSATNQLLGRASRQQDQPSDGQSPLQITDYGRKILDDCDGYKLVDAYKHKLSLVDNMNEYQIQEACVRFATSDLENFLSPSELDKIQKVAFYTNLPIYSVFHTIGLELRDVIFKQRNIKIAPNDEHNPKAD